MYTFEYLVNPSLPTNEFKLAKVCCVTCHSACWLQALHQLTVEKKSCMVASFTESVRSKNGETACAFIIAYYIHVV